MGMLFLMLMCVLVGIFMLMNMGLGSSLSSLGFLMFSYISLLFINVQRTEFLFRILPE